MPINLTIYKYRNKASVKELLCKRNIRLQHADFCDDFSDTS